MSLAVLQRAGAHHIAEHTAEMGCTGKTGLLRHRADGKLCGFQQALCGFNAAVVQVVHDGLPRHPPEQTAQVVR